MIVAIILTVEILRFAPCSPRSEWTLTALQNAAHAQGVSVVCTDTYQGESDLLILWGPGHPARFDPMRQQVARGGHVLALDLSYWQRDTKVRYSFDAPHPQQWVMRRDWPADRFVADGVPVANVWDPSGPVVIAGIGAKALVQYGSVVPAWEASIAADCRARGQRVVYRAKRNAYDAPPGVERHDGGVIEDALAGASLLVTWHSNAAVDAIRMGVPVMCRDGAAAAVCPSTFPAFGTPQPVAPAVRDRFLANLAWYQWAPSEAKSAWKWITETLACR